MNTVQIFRIIKSADGKTYTLEINPEWLAQEPDQHRRDEVYQAMVKHNATPAEHRRL